MESVFKQKINLATCGRTDAGVSAYVHVSHFDTQLEFDCFKTTKYLNALLPLDIRVLELVATDKTFHARNSAKHKTYEYYFYFGKSNPILDKFASHVGAQLNIDAMRQACKRFVGRHDFSAFCASNTAIVDKVRTIISIDIVPVDLYYKLTICGNGFLYNMVRIIMGTLVNVGLHKTLPNEIDDIIKSRNRQNAGKTVSPKGLVLRDIAY